ncbi:hypothetical protein KFK09_023426 [Dendrobium nobile]|uniref:Uncharacterized protein n=1 Tax=Dendrobium nobile TaxID=94219 RepID=A0A8T3AM57_DENNO|nr:hypothetical protein KFK09_023426 [Dendrobium nobile]
MPIVISYCKIQKVRLGTNKLKTNKERIHTAVHNKNNQIVLEMMQNPYIDLLSSTKLTYRGGKPKEKRERDRRSLLLPCLLDHRRISARPPVDALCSAGPPLEVLTSAGPQPDAVAPSDHHLRPSPLPDHRLTSLLRLTTT